MRHRPHDVLVQEMKTVRFSQVVTKCGRPAVHDQWQALERDSVLKKVVKENRLMTVHIHTVGSKKDYGEVGLVKNGQHMLLVFPKGLGAFEGRRVVGIDYDLLKEAAVRAVKKAKPAKEREPSVKSKAADSEKVLRLFRSEEEDQRETPTKKAKPRAAKTPTSRPQPVPSAEAAMLRRQIKKAMKELQSGKAVMACHTLEKSLE